MECLANYKAVLFLRQLFSSKYLPIVSAVVVLACYYLGLEVVSIWYFCLCGIGIMLTCKDVTPIFSVFLFMGVMVSVQHSPSILVDTPSDYFTRPAVLTQAITAITFLVGMVIARIVESVKYRRFKITPIFIGLCAFVVALLLNGIFSEYYTVMDIVFSLFLAIVFLGIFCFANGNIQVNGETYERIAYAFFALLGVLSIELIVAYATYEGIIADGVINRELLTFGWGTYNNFGLYITMCIPAPFYLAAKYKHGWAFTLCGIFSLVVTFLCMSRQAILMGTIIFIVCAVWLLIRTRDKARIINASIMGGLLAIAIIVMAIMHEKIGSIFSSLLVSLETGSTRTIIWKEAFDKFLHYPIFGAGFYSRTRWVWGQSGFANILPRMYHNTVFQLLECSGVVGFGAYMVHRLQTVLSFLKNITHERIFVALVITVILLTSLLDNHIFYLFPTIIYSLLIGVLSLSEKRTATKSVAISKLNGAIETAV